jgi:hypothetical protein
MAVERVEINEPVEGEQMSLEDQLAQQEAEKANQVSQETEAPPTPQEPSGQEEEQQIEEELILGKFKSQEDLVEAYENLEKKVGEKQPEEQQAEAKDKGDTSSPDISNAIEDASNAFSEKGELSEDHFKALEATGIPREFVEAYVKGQQATADAEASAITGAIGGEENYKAMIEWAGANLPAEEVSSYDNIVSTGNPDAARMAVKGLYARYMGEGGGSSVNIAKGGTSKAAIQPFNSNAQVVEAINDRRYQIDPAYRADVEKRISVSPNI